MSVDTLNKNVLKMLSHLNKYPIPDPQMVRDFKWFINAYNLSVKSGEVTAPGQSTCPECPPPSNIGATLTETKFSINGPGLAFDIINGITGIRFLLNGLVEKRIYGVKITLFGITNEPIVLARAIGSDISLDPYGDNWYGQQNLTDGDIVDGEPIQDEYLMIFCTNPAITPNMLIGKEVTISLFTA